MAAKPDAPRHHKGGWPQASYPAAATQHRDQILKRLADGEYLRDIAASLNITPAAISTQLASDPVYILHRQIGAGAQLDKYQSNIDTAEDQLNLARAREGFRAASWRAEREFPSSWGAKQQVEVTVVPVLNITLSNQTPAIEGQAELIESDPT